MPVEFSTEKGGSVAVAYCFGTLVEDDLLDAISFAFGSERLKPGQDRIIVFETDAQLYNLDARALKQIQQRVYAEEIRNGPPPSFRSVLVYSAPMQQQVLQLYKAIWDVLDLQGVQFNIAASKEEALTLLESRPLVSQATGD